MSHETDVLFYIYLVIFFFFFLASLGGHRFILFCSILLTKQVLWETQRLTTYHGVRGGCNLTHCLNCILYRQIFFCRHTHTNQCEGGFNYKPKPEIVCSEFEEMTASFWEIS